MIKGKMKLFDGRGFLNEAGKKRATKFLQEADDLLSTATSENELRLLGSILSNLVGNRVADWAQHNKKAK